jgi:hypothetical protein
MDQRIESFLGDVLALAGEEPDAVRDGVRVALAKCEAIFRLQQPKKRMRDHLPRAVPRSRSRGVTAPQGNAHRRALEAGAQQYRPTPGALSLPEHRFPPPWSVEHRAAAKLLSRDGGWSRDRRDPMACAIAVH